MEDSLSICKHACCLLVFTCPLSYRAGEHSTGTTLNQSVLNSEEMCLRQKEGGRGGGVQRERESKKKKEVLVFPHPPQSQDLEQWNFPSGATKT